MAQTIRRMQSARLLAPDWIWDRSGNNSQEEKKGRIQALRAFVRMENAPWHKADSSLYALVCVVGYLLEQN